MKWCTLGTAEGVIVVQVKSQNASIYTEHGSDSNWTDEECALQPPIATRSVLSYLIPSWCCLHQQHYVRAISGQKCVGSALNYDLRWQPNE
jgi:hypothetical protein